MASDSSDTESGSISLPESLFDSPPTSNSSSPYFKFIELPNRPKVSKVNENGGVTHRKYPECYPKVPKHVVPLQSADLVRQL